jgi:hypothetical protein
MLGGLPKERPGYSQPTVVNIRYSGIVTGSYFMSWFKTIEPE